MRLLVDSEINAALRQPQPIANGLPQPLDHGLGLKTQVQPASLTFVVGDIFLPGTKPDDLGGCNNPRSTYELKQGHTAVIRTREQIHLSPRQAAIGFPPSSQSLKGLLMTNPGHIDPGYSGPLHCTVINMAHSTFHLERGDPIMRVLIFQLDTNEPEPTAPYYNRAQLPRDGIGPTPITAELLDRLSVDFVDVENRASDVAEKQINKAQVRAIWIPVIVAIASGVIAFGTSYLTSTLAVKEDLNKLRDDFIHAQAGLENKDSVNKIELDIASIKDQMNRIQQKLSPTQQGSQQNRNP